MIQQKADIKPSRAGSHFLISKADLITVGFSYFGPGGSSRHRKKHDRIVTFFFVAPFMASMFVVKEKGSPFFHDIYGICIFMFVEVGRERVFYSTWKLVLGGRWLCVMGYIFNKRLGQGVLFYFI